jgi:hypothetical protein
LKRDALSQELGLRTRGLDLQSRGLDQAATSHTDDVALRKRALDISEQGQKNAQSRENLTRVDAQIADTLSVIGETVSQGLAAGKDPQIVSRAVQPLVESARRLATAGGRDASSVDARVAALFARPTGVEAAKAVGTGKGVSAVAEEAAITAAGGQAGGIKDPKDRIAAEGALRDDYMKQAKDFTIIRDARNRLEAIGETGAGDVALVFQYMKVLDPGSTVREGEFATASQAAGVPAHVIGLYNKAVGGGVLAPKARKEIRQEAENMYQRSALQHDKLTTSFANIAKRQKLNVDNVIVDLSPAEKKASGRVSEGFGAIGNIPAPPPGFQIVR